MRFLAEVSLRIIWLIEELIACARRWESRRRLDVLGPVRMGRAPCFG
jgi:hypothetical protein